MSVQDESGRSIESRNSLDAREKKKTVADMGREINELREKQDALETEAEKHQKMLREFVDRYSEEAQANANRDLSPEELEALVANEMHYNPLPNLRRDPDYHYCWLSTENKNDPITLRMQLGYRPVKVSEHPEYNAAMGFKPLSAAWQDYLGSNEMILFKIPKKRYEAIMNIRHHQRPLSMYHSLTQEIKAGASDPRTSMTMESGTKNIEKLIGTPVPQSWE